MLKLSMRIAIAATIVAGSSTIAAAQGFDPNGANRFQRLVQAGTAGYYLGELQGPMAATLLEMAQVSLTAGQIDPYVDQGSVYARRRPYAPATGMIAR